MIYAFDRDPRKSDNLRPPIWEKSMCIVAWAESAATNPNSYVAPTASVTIRHVTEVLTYDFASKTVNIDLLLLPFVSGIQPVYIHCIHRRAVRAINSTSLLVDGISSVAQLLVALRLLRPESSSALGTLVSVRAEDGTELQGIIPTHAGFALDEYCNVNSAVAADIPFTSIRFGPLSPSPTPHVLGLSLMISGDTFDRLIAVLPNHVQRYIYGMEGPQIICRDIEPLDLHGAAPDIRACYNGVLKSGIQKNSVQIESYDVLTCDAPAECSHYVRLVNNLRQYRIEQAVAFRGREYLLNSWHSNETDFLIQRVSFSAT
jgi:hypothetical protein